MKSTVVALTAFLLTACQAVKPEETPCDTVLWNFDTSCDPRFYITELTDVEEKGKSMAIISTPSDTSGAYGQMQFTLDKGEYPWDPYAIYTCLSSGAYLDATSFNGIQFRHRGAAVSFTINSVQVKDYAYHEHQIPASESWQTITLNLNSDFKQPAWCENWVSFQRDSVVGFNWIVNGQSGDTGIVEIDDLTLLVDAPEKTIETEFFDEPRELIQFSNSFGTRHEDQLSQFDSLGIAVVLGVESGDADLIAVMDSVMNRFGHHQSVKGYCIDIEWITKDAPHEGYGRPVTDSIATLLDNHLKTAYGRDNLQLVLKHWDTRWLPETYRSDIIFINDGQEFQSAEDLESYMSNWFQAIPNNTVLFQIGYPSDYHWWKDLTNPLATIGETIAKHKNENQKTGMLWVDFAANYPEVSLFDGDAETLNSNSFTVEGESVVDFAGIRVSSYGGFPCDNPDEPNHPYSFPDASSAGWSIAAQNMVHAYPGSSPLLLWGVGHIDLNDNSTVLEFSQN